MYLHLGNDCVIRKDELLGIFDLDNTSASYLTREFLRRAEEAGQVINAAGTELPKSFALCAGTDTQRLCLSQLNAATLGKRAEHSRREFS